MSSARSRAALSRVSVYIQRNKKVVISLVAAFFIALAVGVGLALRAVGGEFETVIRSEVETGTGKVFFLSTLILLLSYAIIAASGANSKTVILAFLPFLALGFFTGRYATALIGRYDVFGVINLLFVYLPFFLGSLVLMIVATVSCLSAGCEAGCEKSPLKPSFLRALKLFAINVAWDFVFIVIIGSIAGGVIIVTLF